MEIKSYPVKLGEIFGIINSKNIKSGEYIIPGYQRPYEWSEEQLKTVVESIDNGLNGDGEPLLFGTIHFNKTEGNAYEIIDGQQRLTTFYLMLKSLDEDVKFSPKNEINKSYECDLSNATNSSFDFKNKKYYENYMFIKNHIDRTTKNVENYRKKLYDYIIKSITFVVIETENNKSIEKTLQIFSSLNTTGLSLGVKDVFKIKFRDHLKKNNTESEEELFERINNAYDDVTGEYTENSPYYVSENDLIETFKLYLIGKENSEHCAEKIKMSNNAFFEDVFEKNNKNATAETFFDIAKTIKATQKLLEKEDKKEIRTDYTLPFAKELLDWCGYCKLKNVLYLLVYCQCKESEPEMHQVDTALKLTEIIWKFCSIYRTVTAKVLNGVFNCVGKSIINKAVNESFDWNEMTFEEIKNIFNKAIADDTIDKRAKEFSDIAENNVFDNPKRGFFLALSYIGDSHSASAFEIKKTLFYREQWDLDIEHIASIKLYADENSNLINSLGNLIYLERKINRSLGSDTKKLSREEDLVNKQKQYREYVWKYKDKKAIKGSQLNSVKALYDNADTFKNWTAKDILDKIEERRKEKIVFLKSIYKDFSVFTNN